MTCIAPYGTRLPDTAYPHSRVLDKDGQSSYI
jgi:hypothetical protein